MTAEGTFPKIDGDIYYAKDANIAVYNGFNSSTLNYNGISLGSDASILIAANSSRKSILIKNNDSTTMWVGDSGLSLGSGYEIKPKTSIYLTTADVIYGIVDSAIGTGSINVRYLEVQ